MKKFSPRELIEYDGKNGRRAFIAFNGKVYDVTDSSKWRDGLHFKAHSAGTDLSNALHEGTHGPEVLAGFPVVGDFDAAENISIFKRFLLYTANRHVHSISSHFTVSSFVLSPIILICSMVIPEWRPLESLSFQLLIIGFLSLPFTIITGLIDWWVKYSYSLNSLIKKKLLFSASLLLVSTIIVLWRFFDPTLILVDSSFWPLYVCLNLFAFLCNAILGKVGGALTFPALYLDNIPSGKHSARIKELLEMAIIREKESYEFYLKLGRQIHDRDQSELIAFLMHQEQMHEEKLKGLIENIAKRTSEKQYSFWDSVNLLTPIGSP